MNERLIDRSKINLLSSRKYPLCSRSRFDIRNKINIIYETGSGGGGKRPEIIKGPKRRERLWDVFVCAEEFARILDETDLHRSTYSDRFCWWSQRPLRGYPLALYPGIYTDLCLLIERNRSICIRPNVFMGGQWSDRTFNQVELQILLKNVELTWCESLREEMVNSGLSIP